MRVERWNPEAYDLQIETASIDRLEEAAEVVAGIARINCPVGTVTRPVYKTGKYAGQEWTKRDAGALKKTIRVRKKLSKSGKPLKRKSNVRIYAGNKVTYYASIVEHAVKPFIRPALVEAHSQVMAILKR